MIANMAKTGWPWGEILMDNLGLNKQNFQNNDINDGFDIWNRLKKWQNRPPPNPDNIPITKEEVIARLKSLLPNNKEERIEQFKYSTNLLDSFNPKQSQEPLITVAEGGTGVGKTIAYLAPASIWAEKTKHLFGYRLTQETCNIKFITKYQSYIKMKKNYMTK